jgi:hypothetical protein
LCGALVNRVESMTRTLYVSVTPMIINEHNVLQGTIALPKERRALPAERRDYVTLSIPRELYEKAENAIKGTGFRSVTEYAIFVLRESLLLKAGESVRDRLKALGYID